MVLFHVGWGDHASEGFSSGASRVDSGVGDSVSDGRLA